MQARSGETLIKNKTLLMVDIEGDEVKLLDPVKVPHLVNTDLLIEIHEDTKFTQDATAEGQLTDRLAASHFIERRLSQSRKTWIKEYHQIWHDKVSEEEMAKAVDEDRHCPTVWFWAKTKE